MLYNDIERGIMSRARQPNMRRSHPSGQKAIARIVDTVLVANKMSGAKVLELGPGQCDFLDIARSMGATTFGIDFDPAVVQLGKLRGHTMTLHNLSTGWPLGEERFDGIFCRGSINCFWFVKQTDQDRLDLFLDNLSGALNPDGWLWIVPWNKPATPDQALEDETHTTVAMWAQRSGVTIQCLDDEARMEYQLNYQIPRVEIWQKNCSSMR